MKVDETARGLLYLHDNNIIHGDMKGVNNFTLTMIEG